MQEHLRLAMKGDISDHSASVHRWKILTDHLGLYTIKKHSDTHWEARISSVKAVRYQWSRSNAHQVALKNLDIQASGLYSCEVSLETPIYTKASSDHELTVIIPQSAAPRITFGAREYTVGELLEANCTSVPAHPPPHITWLINGKKVDEKMTRTFPQPISLGHVGKAGTPLRHHNPPTSPPAPMYDIAPH
ncbi:uncharacterized protein LOC113374971 [Ctenocephalides felis]|uniref:uncharacterized protein LOC113374971 n=1 Tax=Ctenocephalides felis TaxID=7515 RepID=UPI000E6E116A|nr:uncharacterized protein LOC113374971 [Ctenocephalides felis]